MSGRFVKRPQADMGAEAACAARRTHHDASLRGLVARGFATRDAATAEIG